MKLKHLISKASLFLLLSAPVVLTSCEKDDDPAPTPTITETVVASANFSLLKAAVVRAGLGEETTLTKRKIIIQDKN